MIINIIETFIFSVLAIYTFYQNYIKQNGAFELYFYVTVEWFLLYLIITLTVIYMAHLLTNEVSLKIVNFDSVLEVWSI